MHARVTRMSTDASRRDENIKLFNDQILPRFEQIPGYREFLMLIDDATGDAIGITIWESEEALRASEDAANAIRSDAAQKMASSIVSVERFEVAVQASALYAAGR